MKKYTVTLFEEKHIDLWNTFVAQAKNATFLFHRDFMTYHADRFSDFSLLIFSDKGNLEAILPANRVGETIYSHQGLTYGGLVLQEKAKLSHVIAMYKQLLVFLEEQKIKTFYFKEIPRQYTTHLSDESAYILFLLKAKQTRVDAMSVIDLTKKNKIASNRKQEINKALKFDLTIKEETDFSAFWHTLLEPNLAFKRNLKPVHSIKDIHHLKEKFPNQIRLFTSYYKDQLLAGTLVFETETVAHCQYISSNKELQNYAGLDYLIHHLITEQFKGKTYFDIGMSNENDGLHTNKGLLFWKESFGTKTITQHFYSIDVSNHKLLDTIWI